MPILQKIASRLKLGGLILHPLRVSSTMIYVRRQRLSYLELPALYDLASAVRHIETNNVQGVLIEAGCALAGSSLVIASAKRANRHFNMYDTFEMIPPPSARDGKEEHERYEKIVSGQAEGIGRGMYYGYHPDLLGFIEANFNHCGLPIHANHIHLMKGLFEQTLFPEGPVAFAHLDCDWYDSVMTCLQRITPHLSPGGVMVIDDYFYWSGCKQAIDEYFEDKKDQYIFQVKSRLNIIRKY